MMKILQSIGRFLQSAWQFLFCFRKIFLSIPVVITAIVLARRNLAQLPARVGLILSTDGTFSLLITKHQAVYGCLALTLLCLVLMALSRKVFYPWLVSVITLVLPPLLLLLNQLF